MNKSYEVKIYSIDGVFKKTLSGKEIIDRFEFSSQINWWQWEAILILNKEFWDTDISAWDVAKVYVYTDLIPGWQIIYTGYISRPARKYSAQKTVIEYQMIGISSILNFINFYSWSYSFNKNQDPAQTIKDVIDYFNTKYTAGLFSYSWGNIDNFWSNISIDFYYRKCLNSIQGAVDSTGFWWRIGADGQVFFKANPLVATHRFTAWKDVNELIIEESIEEVVNKYFLFWKSGMVMIEDLTSQSLYGVREFRESITEIADVGSATTYATNFIAKNKDIKKKTSLIINNQYNIENIFPGETLKVLNIDYSVINLQIQKVSYTPEIVKLDVEILENIWKTIFNP